jgi:hypothetical protein
MQYNLQKIISSSTFEAYSGSYIYAKTNKIPIDVKFFALTVDNDEITVVLEKSHIDGLDFEAKNKDEYSLIALNVLVPFYCVGFLAEITKVIASKGMNILIVSTFSKDYILVRSDKREDALKALLELGLRQEPTQDVKK